MNLLLSPNIYLPRRAGVPLSTQSLAAAFVKKGHQVVIVTPQLQRDHSSFEVIDGVEVHRMPFVTRRRLLRLGSSGGALTACLHCPRDIRRLVRLMAEKHIEIMNIHSLAGPNLPYLLVSLFFAKSRLVVSLHADQLSSAPHRSVRRFLLRLALRRAERITAISDRVATDAARFCPEASHKIVKIVNGVPVHEFGRSAAFAFPSRYILSVARLHPSKGHDVLLAAFQKLAESEKNVHLIIAGDGSQRVRLRALGMALGLRDRVSFLGEVGRERVKELLAGCEFLVLSSWAEGMPLAALEAMASGKAVVATDVGALSEIITDSETGRLVPPGDPQSLAEAMLTLLGNHDQRRAMGERGRMLVKARHDFSNIANRYLDIYRKVLQGARTSP